MTPHTVKIVGVIKSISAVFPYAEPNPDLENGYKERELGRVVMLEGPDLQEEHLAGNEKLLKSLEKEDYVEVIYGLMS